MSRILLLIQPNQLPSPVVHTTSAHAAPTKYVPVCTHRKKRLVPRSGLSSAKRARVTTVDSCSAPAQVSGSETATDTVHHVAPFGSRRDRHSKLREFHEDFKQNVGRLSEA